MSKLKLIDAKTMEKLLLMARPLIRQIISEIILSVDDYNNILQDL